MGIQDGLLDQRLVERHLAAQRATGMADSKAYRRWFRAHRTQRTVPDLLSDDQRRSVIVGFGLTPREGEVLWQMFSDSSNEAIAAKLTVSENTVRTHRERLFAKLGVAGSTEAVAIVSAAIVAMIQDGAAPPPA